MRKNRMFLAVSLMLVAALVLGACAQATPTEAPPVATEAPTVPPPPPPPPTEVPLGSAENADHHGPRTFRQHPRADRRW